MKTTNQKKKMVVCYGEVLWDIFPTKSKPGGAPMNVAYHLHKFGIDSRMISRIGNDEAGQKLLNLLNVWSIPTKNCQIDPVYETGKVIATVLPDNEMSYEIQSPVAWDFIITDFQNDRLVSQADAFVFGSLVTRNESSRKTLYRLIEKATYTVFDVNLRQPHYSPEIIVYLLGKCNLLKLNESELALIISWFSNENMDEKSAVQYLQNKFNIDEVIITQGSKGASYYTKTSICTFPAFKVEVKDTCGSGDSFLAAFLAKKLENESPETGMIYATGLGAFVAAHEGACPVYDLSLLETFISQTQSV
jgi:fructokinase